MAKGNLELTQGTYESFLVPILGTIDHFPSQKVKCQSKVSTALARKLIAGVEYKFRI